MCPDSCELDSRQTDGDLNIEADTREFSIGAMEPDVDESNSAISKPEVSKFVMRVPADLLDQLKHVSRHHNRSMNAEINLLLGRYIEQVKGEPRPGVDEHLKLDSLLLQKLSALPAQKIEALLDLLD